MKTPLAIFLAMLGLVSEIRAGCCKNGWISFEDHCYYIGHSNLRTQFSAKSFCTDIGGYLVTFETFAEYEFLRTYLKKSKASSVWIGLNDVKHEGIWRWDSSNEHATFSDWASGQPNNKGNEDCVRLDSGYDYKWNDVACLLSFNPFFFSVNIPLCERE